MLPTVLLAGVVGVQQPPVVGLWRATKPPARRYGIVRTVGAASASDEEDGMQIRTRGLTYAGIACIIGGFAVLGFVWGRVAALTAVPLQLPYLVSGGLTALGLIMVGVLLINIQTKLADALRRDRQLQQLGEVLEQIRAAVLGEPLPTVTVAGREATDGDDDDDTDAVPFARPDPELQTS